MAALAADPDVMAKSGRVYASWTLAKEYGVADADGTRPDFAAHLEAAYGPEVRRLQPRLDDAYYRYLGDLAGLRRTFEKEFAAMDAKPEARGSIG